MCMPCWRDFTCGRGWVDFCAKWTKVWVPQQVSRDFLHKAFMFVSDVHCSVFLYRLFLLFQHGGWWNAGSLRYKCVVSCVRDVAMIRFYKFLCQDCVFALCSMCFGLSLFSRYVDLENFSKVSWESGFVWFFSVWGSDEEVMKKDQIFLFLGATVPWVGDADVEYRLCSSMFCPRVRHLDVRGAVLVTRGDWASQRGTFVGNALGRRVMPVSRSGPRMASPVSRVETDILARMQHQFIGNRFVLHLQTLSTVILMRCRAREKWEHEGENFWRESSREGLMSIALLQLFRVQVGSLQVGCALHLTFAIAMQP